MFLLPLLPLSFWRDKCPRLVASRVHGGDWFESKPNSLAGSYRLLRADCGVNYSCLRDTLNARVVEQRPWDVWGSKQGGQTAGRKSPEGGVESGRDSQASLPWHHPNQGNDPVLCSCKMQLPQETGGAQTLEEVVIMAFTSAKNVLLLVCRGARCKVGLV